MHIGSLYIQQLEDDTCNPMKKSKKTWLETVRIDLKVLNVADKNALNQTSWECKLILPTQLTWIKAWWGWWWIAYIYLSIFLKVTKTY